MMMTDEEFRAFIDQHLPAWKAFPGMDDAEYARRVAEAFGYKPKDADEQFAAEVLATARRVPSAGWFGQKVFISAIWKRGFQQHMTLESFKIELAKAQKRMLLTLSRADMGHALDQTMVRESETKLGLGDEVHFVRID